MAFGQSILSQQQKTKAGLGSDIRTVGVAVTDLTMRHFYNFGPFCWRILEIRESWIGNAIGRSEFNEPFCGSLKDKNIKENVAIVTWLVACQRETEAFSGSFM